MPKRQYHIVNGKIIGETTGGVRTDYLTDALGSVTGTVNQSAQVRNTYRWKPYGSLLASTGADPDPGVGWNGTWGYRPTSRLRASHYVVHRHYDQISGQWTTPVPLWWQVRRFEKPFSYAAGTPVRLIDASGLDPTRCKSCCCCVSSLWKDNRRILDNFIDDWRGDGLRRNGHEFRLALSISSSQEWSEPKFGNCTLDWGENSPSGVLDPTTGNVLVDEWTSYDGEAGKLDVKYTFDQWRKRRSSCGGPEIIRFVDRPTVARDKLYNDGKGGYRNLFIHLRVWSAKGCPCPTKVVCIRVTQRLEFDPDKAGDRNKGYGWLLVPWDPEPSDPLKPVPDWKECKPL